MRKNTLKIPIIFLFIVLLSGCQEEAGLKKEEPSPLAEAQSATIGLALAKSLEDSDFQNLVVEEAKKKFDQDHDVLIQMIKDKEVRPGITFMDVLIQNADEESNIESLINASPLLTIFVPELPEFSVSKWDVASGETPKVALSLNPGVDKMTVIDKAGTVSEVSRHTAPSFPVLVLKDNERVAVTSGQSIKTNAGARGRKPVFKNELYSFSLTNDNDESNVDATNTRLASFYTFSPKVRDAYDKSVNCSNCYHRDYIYYNISPTDGVLQGPFDQTYYETITSIRMANITTLNAITSDWTEGGLEFHINIFFLGSNSSLDRLEKVIHLDPNVFMVNGQLNPLGYTASRVTIVPWRMDLYGDRWKIGVIEYDPGTVVTQQYSNSSTTGVNFTTSGEGNLFSIVKVGVGFGLSNTTTTTSSATVQTTLESNNLGEAVLNWFDPIIVSKTKTGLGGYTSTSMEITTGSVLIGVEPVGN